jgi:hypothetical protein
MSCENVLSDIGRFFASCANGIGRIPSALLKTGLYLESTGNDRRFFLGLAELWQMNSHGCTILRFGLQVRGHRNLLKTVV